MSDVMPRYIVRADLHLRPTPAGSAQVLVPGVSLNMDVPASLVDLLFRFGRPLSIDECHREIGNDWDIERLELALIVKGWVEAGLLVVSDDKPLALDRLAVFNEALAAEDRQGKTGKRSRFRLCSPLPLQQPDLYYPGLGTLAVYEPQQFPWVGEIEATYPEIRRELEALVAAGGSFRRVYEKHTSEGEWAAAYLSLFGERNASIADRCPSTMKVLSTVPGALEYGTVMFSALSPRAFVAPHCGHSNAKLRCQLPLYVPAGCSLRIGDCVLEQVEGRCLVFDDSFLHSAWNLSDEARFVLLFDFFHPDLTAPEIARLRQLSNESALAADHRKQTETAAMPAWIELPTSARR